MRKERVVETFDLIKELKELWGGETKPFKKGSFLSPSHSPTLFPKFFTKGRIFNQVTQLQIKDPNILRE